MERYLEKKEIQFKRRLFQRKIENVTEPTSKSALDFFEKGF